MNTKEIQLNIDRVDAALVALEAFSQQYYALIEEMKLQDVAAQTQIALESTSMALQADANPIVALLASQKEQMAIMDAVMKVLEGIEGVTGGMVRWSDYTAADARLEALVYPESPNGKVRTRYQDLPCFKQVTEFYSRVQKLVDGLAVHAAPMSAALH